MIFLNPLSKLESRQVLNEKRTFPNSDEIRENVSRIVEEQKLPAFILVGHIIFGISFILLGIVGALNQITPSIAAVFSLALFEFLRGFILLIVSLLSILFGWSFISFALVLKRLATDKNAPEALYVNLVNNGIIVNGQVIKLEKREKWIIHYEFYVDVEKKQHQYQTSVEPDLKSGDLVNVLYDEKTQLNVLI